MSDYIHKKHNVSVLLYHIVIAVKYRKSLLSEEIDQALCDICFDISDRYEIDFIEIGAESDHIHFLVQSVPSYSPTKIVRTIKSLTAREIFRRFPSVKQLLWGGEFWSKGYFIATVGSHGDEAMIREYVKNQNTGKNYKPFHQEVLEF